MSTDQRQGESDKLGNERGSLGWIKTTKNWFS